MKLVSVVVPIFNVENYLEECLTSIVNQTYSETQIVLVDDGSTDGSGNIADYFAEKDERIQVIHKPNGGLVSARKAGLQIARGDYVICVDSDDWIEDNMIEEMVAAAQHSDADVVTSGCYREYGNKTVIDSELMEAGIYSEERLFKVFLPNMVGTERFFEQNIKISVIGKLYKNHLLRKYQMQVPDIINVGEDAAVVYPCLLNSKCIYVTGKKYYHYRIRPGSVAETRKKNEIESLKQLSILLDREFGIAKSWLPCAMIQSKAIAMFNRLVIYPETVVKIIGDELYPYSNVNKNDRVVLYGAGRYGKRLYDHLNNIGIRTIGIVDSSASNGTIGLDQLKDITYDRIVMAVLKSNLVADIMDNLRRHGIDTAYVSNIDIKKIVEGL